MVMFEISTTTARTRHPVPCGLFTFNRGVVASTYKFGPRGKVGICISARRSDAVRLHL